MIIYEVTVQLESGEDETFERYMRERHIPAIFETRCFVAARFEKSGERRYRTVYHAAAEADLERYLESHATGFRADFMEHFPSGAFVTRQVWDVMESWPQTD